MKKQLRQSDKAKTGKAFCINCLAFEKDDLDHLVVASQLEYKYGPFMV